MLTSVELLSMDGLLKMEQAQGTKSIPLPRLINLTFNADCHIVPDVFNDESLGAFLYENEMLTKKEVRCLLNHHRTGQRLSWASSGESLGRTSPGHQCIYQLRLYGTKAGGDLRKCIGLVRWLTLTSQVPRWCWK